MFIKQSEATAALRKIYFFCADDDSADSYAPKTGLTFASGELKISKGGAADFNASNYATTTEIGGGWYTYEFSTGEVDTVGPLLFRTNKTDVYSDAQILQVVPWNPYDSTSLGITRLDATVSSRLPTTSYESLTTQLDAASTVETGLSLRGFYRLAAAVLFGKVSGAGTGTEVFRNAIADTKARVTSAVDTSGNRTTVTTDQT